MSTLRFIYAGQEYPQYVVEVMYVFCKSNAGRNSYTGKNDSPEISGSHALVLPGQKGNKITQIIKGDCCVVGEIFLTVFFMLPAIQSSKPEGRIDRYDDEKL